MAERLQTWGAPTPETLAFNARLSALLKGAPAPEAEDISLMRQIRAAGKSILPISGPAPGAVWADLPADQIPPGGAGQVRLIEAEHSSGVYLHIHGGGWSIGAPDQSDGRNLTLSRAAGVTVISVRYRLAPEHRWPAQAEDCFAAAAWALDYAAERGLALVIGGESAGAHLAAVTLLHLRAIGRLAPVAGAVLSYGAFDLRGTPSVLNWGEENLILSTPITAWCVEQLVGETGVDLASPEISPLLADLTGLPPAYFICGTLDPLIDDTLFMAERWRAAGGQATLSIWPGAVHAFDYFVDPKHRLPIAAESDAAQAAFIASRLGA